MMRPRNASSERSRSVSLPAVSVAPPDSLDMIERLRLARSAVNAQRWAHSSNKKIQTAPRFWHSANMICRWLAAFVVFLPVAFLSAQDSAGSKATLFLDADEVRPGETVMAGLRLQMPEKWHTYWRNPGESGEATTIEWLDLPKGISVGAIQWPVPERHDIFDTITFVYHGEVMLLVPLQIAPDFKPGNVDLKAKVNWLECEEICVLGKATVAATFEVGAKRRHSKEAQRFDFWKKRMPVAAAPAGLKAAWNGPVTGKKRSVRIEFTPSDPAAAYDWFPLANEGVDVSARTEIKTAAGRVTLTKSVEVKAGKWPEQIGGIIVAKMLNGAPTGYEFSVAVVEQTAGLAGPTKSKGEFWTMLLLAFLGGLILNIMPCVLPVIALKVLGFVQQSKDSPEHVRRLGLIYTMGVVASFLVLAGFVVGVQKAGDAASWGMQMQYPGFRLTMLAVVTLVALNLFGVFEMNLSGSLTGTAGALASRQGETGAFFNGVLATALATPCTAPFLAPALGYAFTQPPSVVVVMFIGVGLGLASPYLVLSFRPDWLRFLPKPGAWMEKFKIAMGFPMLATVVWLFSLVAPTQGEDGVLVLGLALTLFALAVWIWGEFVQRGESRRGLALVICAALLSGSGYLALGKSTVGIDWQPWSEEAVAKARMEKRPVLVDFTAQWCLTCKANKKSSIEVESVRNKLKELGAVALIADNTNKREDIAEELAKFQRAGVPMVLVYSRDGSSPPKVLPTLLTPGIVLEALDWAVK